MAKSSLLRFQALNSPFGFEPLVLNASLAFWTRFPSSSLSATKFLLSTICWLYQYTSTLTPQRCVSPSLCVQPSTDSVSILQGSRCNEMSHQALDCLQVRHNRPYGVPEILHQTLPFSLVLKISAFPACVFLGVHLESVTFKFA